MDSMAHKSKRKGSTARLAWARMAGTGPSLHFLRSNFAPNTLRARESVGSAQGGAVRGRCRRSRCGIPGETDLQEDARLAVYKLGEDANGELWMRGHGDG